MVMKSCLLVDDSRVIRRVARGIIENLSFSCSEAGDGETAVAACTATMPDAILLDWTMPGMSGIETLKVIRALPGGDQPKIVLCTTNSEIEHITRALEEGADEYIMKPFDDDIIRSKFEQIGLI
jgi:two-component system chemotaxis response regulator CheY